MCGAHSIVANHTDASVIETNASISYARVLYLSRPSGCIEPQTKVVSGRHMAALETN